MRLIGRLLKLVCSSSNAAAICAPQIKLTRPCSSSSQLRPKVVFFGTDLLSIRILQGLHQLLNTGHIQAVKAVTSVNPAAAKNDSLRGNRIVDYCAQNNIECHLWSDLRAKRADNYGHLFASYHVGVVASFGHLIPSALIELFP